MTLQYQDVVCGFILPIEEDETQSQDAELKILCSQRPDSAEHFPSLYEFAGGKVDPGETHHAALVREVEEEMGVRVRVIEKEPAFQFSHPPKLDKRKGGQVVFRLYFYWARLIANEDGSSPSPKALASQQVLWLTPAEMSKLTFCPGDEDIIAGLENGTLRPRSAS